MSVSNSLPRISRNCPEVGIYQKKQESKIERKHAFHQESDQEKRKKNSNQLEQEKKASFKILLFFFYEFPPLWSPGFVKIFLLDISPVFPYVFIHTY